MLKNSIMHPELVKQFEREKKMKEMEKNNNDMSYYMGMGEDPL